jgi:hypothetical protein
MNVTQESRQAGLVYSFAAALNRRNPNHIAIDQAEAWLGTHVYGSETEKLVSNGSANLSHSS